MYSAEGFARRMGRKRQGNPKKIGYVQRIIPPHKPCPMKEEEMVEISIIIVNSDRIPDKSR